MASQLSFRRACSLRGPPRPATYGRLEDPDDGEMLLEGAQSRLAQCKKVGALEGGLGVPHIPLPPHTSCQADPPCPTWPGYKVSYHASVSPDG